MSVSLGCCMPPLFTGLAFKHLARVAPYLVENVGISEMNLHEATLVGALLTKILTAAKRFSRAQLLLIFIG